jgi:hypothetical protein
MVSLLPELAASGSGQHGGDTPGPAIFLYSDTLPLVLEADFSTELYFQLT